MCGFICCNSLLLPPRMLSFCVCVCSGSLFLFRRPICEIIDIIYAQTFEMVWFLGGGTERTSLECATSVSVVLPYPLYEVSWEHAEKYL